MREPGKTETRSAPSRQAPPPAPSPFAARLASVVGAVGRALTVFVACAGLSAVTAGCAAPQAHSVVLAATSGDFAVGMGATAPGAAPAAGGGFLGSGIEGASGPVQFADGTTATVTLGAKYFAASGRWCRHFRPVTATAALEPPASTEIACLADGGWRRARPVVVNRFSDTSRS